MEGSQEAPEVSEADERRARRRRVSEALASLKALQRRWASERDSEALWEEEHALLVRLNADGEARTVAKFAGKAKRALAPKGSDKDLADAALGLWVLGRLDEAVPVLRAAMERLPANRYPWDLMLRQVSSKGSPASEVAFIEGQLERVPWKGFAMLQLGARHVDAAGRSLALRDVDDSLAHLEAARAALERAKGERDTTDEMGMTADRLVALVARLEQRLSAPERTPEGKALKRLFEGYSETQKMEGQVRAVADAAGVKLEGEVDTELDLDELERIAMQEDPDSKQEPTVTVIRVTPTLATAEDRKRKPGPPSDKG
jgi:hypothetical protein